MNNMLRTALTLNEMGFAVHWCLPKSKAPIEGGWAKAPIKSQAELEQTYRDGYNVGFRPGKYSVVDKHEIIVLDLDLKGGSTYATEAYAAAETLIGVDEKFHVKSGSGPGRHLYIKVPIGKAPNRNRTVVRESDIWIRNGVPCLPHSKEGKLAWAIEILSTGQNCILPPSIHPESGRPYEWLLKEFSV